MQTRLTFDASRLNARIAVKLTQDTLWRLNTQLPAKLGHSRIAMAEPADARQRDDLALPWAHRPIETTPARDEAHWQIPVQIRSTDVVDSSPSARYCAHVMPRRMRTSRE
jgi:hypothetical protein